MIKMVGAENFLKNFNLHFYHKANLIKLNYKKMKVQRKHTIYILMLLFVAACYEPAVEEPIGQVEGLKPVYSDAETVDVIVSLPPQAIKKLGKIYYKDDFM
jgi:hypothetical protein